MSIEHLTDTEWEWLDDTDDEEDYTDWCDQDKLDDWGRYCGDDDYPEEGYYRVEVTRNPSRSALTFTQWPRPSSR
jgi:hypothetical protein